MAFPDVIKFFLERFRETTHRRVLVSILHGSLSGQAGWANILILSFLQHPKAASPIRGASVTTA